MSLRLRKSLFAGALVFGVVGFGVSVPVVAHAQEYVSASVEGVEEERDVPDEVLEENIEQNQPETEANTEVLAETADRGLAFTGTDAATLVALGTASVALGGVALAARRRNQAAANS